MILKIKWVNASEALRTFLGTLQIPHSCLFSPLKDLILLHSGLCWEEICSLIFIPLKWICLFCLVTFMVCFLFWICSSLIVMYLRLYFSLSILLLKSADKSNWSSLESVSSYFFKDCFASLSFLVFYVYICCNFILHPSFMLFNFFFF